jgi:hypothetical protein
MVLYASVRMALLVFRGPRNAKRKQQGNAAN